MCLLKWNSTPEVQWSRYRGGWMPHPSQYWWSTWGQCWATQWWRRIGLTYEWPQVCSQHETALSSSLSPLPPSVSLRSRWRGLWRSPGSGWLTHPPGCYPQRRTVSQESCPQFPSTASCWQHSAQSAHSSLPPVLAYVQCKSRTISHIFRLVKKNLLGLDNTPIYTLRPFSKKLLTVLSTVLGWKRCKLLVNCSNDYRSIEMRSLLTLSGRFVKNFKMAHFRQKCLTIAHSFWPILGVLYRGTLRADQGMNCFPIREMWSQ